MRLVCRECSAAYEAPDSLFGPQPREVRCNRCGFQWTVTGPAKPATAGAGAAPLSPMPPVPAAPAPAPAEQAAAPTPQPGVQQPPAATNPARTTETPAVKPPGPVPLRAEPAAASTRALIGDPPADAAEIILPDGEERRLSHELSFGDMEHQPAQRKPHSFRPIWFVILVVLVLIIAAILFKPQLVGAFPGLDALYAIIGL